MAEISPESIGYAETHGTGTHIDDPIEFAASTETFDTSHRQYCALEAVKTNIGCIRAAVGVAGLIETALVLHHRATPPLANYQMSNSEPDLTHSPFYIPTQPQEWPASQMPPRAGVSSFGIGDINAYMVLKGLSPTMHDDHDQVRAPVFIPLSVPSFEQLDESTQQLTPLLATLDASTLAYTQQVVHPVFDCHQAIQVENDGTQAVLASLGSLMPDIPRGLHCPDLRTTNGCTYARWLAHLAYYRRKVAVLTALFGGMNIPSVYCHTETWVAQANSSLLIRGCQIIVALKTWMNLLPTLTLPSSAGTGLLPTAAASGMIAAQDVLHLLWEMEQKALHLRLPERHEPIPDYALTWQESPITDAQRNDRGFWSKTLLADTRELGEDVRSINWARLPPKIRKDVDVSHYVV